MNEPMFEVKEEKASSGYAEFVISPLSQGFGDTLGNSLRRVLLSSIPGLAVSSVKIASVKHQFSTLKGMKEDVVEFVLNLKKVRFELEEGFSEDKIYSEGKKFKAIISVKEAGEVKAKDIKVSTGIKVVNPELVLANLNKGTKLEADLEIMAGFGYSPAEDRKGGGVGLIPVDAAFSPVVRVNYNVEETRVGRVTNYDKLILRIWTDGTSSAKDSLAYAGRVLVSYFTQIVAPKKVKKEEIETPLDTLGAVGKLSVEEIGLPTRVANALAKAGFETVEDLVKAKRQDLVKVRNLGEKSLKIISAALGTKGVQFEY